MVGFMGEQMAASVVFLLQLHLYYISCGNFVAVRGRFCSRSIGLTTRQHGCPCVDGMLTHGQRWRATQ